MKNVDLVEPLFDALSDIKKREAEKISEIELEVRDLLATLNRIGK